jgi:DNA topoisomerase IB
MKLKTISEETEIESFEPAGYFEFSGTDYPYWGNPNGSTKTKTYDIGKFNRYAKLGTMADELVLDFKGMIESDWSSTDARCAFASIVMMRNGIRIGNEDSAEGYTSGLADNEGEFVQTYGTTTLLNKHVSFTENGLNLEFLGKTQVEQNIDINDPFISKYARIYHNESRPEDRWLGIDYDTLFSFVKDNVGSNFIPKDFRTFCANTTGWRTINKFLPNPEVDTKTEANDEIKLVVKSVASKLGNTEGISKRNYIDNRMLDWFKNERLSSDD